MTATINFLKIYFLHFFTKKWDRGFTFQTAKSSRYTSKKKHAIKAFTRYIKKCQKIYISLNNF